MLKIYRNVLAAGIVGLGLAACGDKVTVTQPVTPTPGVTSVTVAPANLTISIGESVQYAASVIADAGVATSVNWSSGNPAIATVDGTGKVTGVAAGTTTIVAASTADAGKKGIASVTVSAVPPAITTFTISPTTATLAPGNFVQISPAYTLANGASTPAITYLSSNSAVATVDGNGKVVAVSAGTAVITATATSGSSTKQATLGVTVRALIPATISISSVTTGILTLPVNLNNVAGQIEFNMNFNPGEQVIDSIAVFIGAKRAAKAFYVTNPAAGIISLSVPTNEFTKNITTGVATTSYLNGNTTFSAAIYPRGVATATSTQVTPMVLNNVDGWAADITKPTVSATSAAGFTFWGGPTAPTSATIYPVIYTPGRSISTVTWTIGAPGGGTCSTVTQTTQPFTRTFGATGATACAYENTTTIRDNIIVTNALDNQNNTFPVVNAVTPLIANTTYLAQCAPVAAGCVTGSTPDSLRIDYVAPAVAVPSIARTAPAVTGWVNAAFTFTQTAATTDAGVGVRATTDRTYSYNAPNCGGATNVAMPTKTGADIPECPTNFIGGAVGLGGTAPYTVKATESDRLGNTATSAATATFGVDKTAPAIRFGLVQAAPALVASIKVDTTTFTAKPVSGTNVWRAEYLDERSGFSATAQKHSMSVGSHISPTGACFIGTGAVGAAFVTAPTCTMATATAGALRLDGWQAGQQVDVPLPEQYAAYTTNVTDAAGNTSSNLFGKTLVNALAPFATGLGIPAQLTKTNFGFGATGADSAEVSALSMQLSYPSLAGTDGGTATDSVRYNWTVIGTRFDDVITSPFAQTISPTTGAPYAHSIELVDASKVFGTDPSNIFAVGTQVKPTKVQTWTFNFGGYNTASTEIAIPALNVENNATINAFNVANPTVAVKFWRVIPSVATSNQFGSTVALRAQATAPTNSPNPPFTRVDFYRLVGGYYSYLGSVSASNVEVSTACATVAEVCGTDQGTYRSWVYQLPAASYVKRWDGVTQTTVVSTDAVIAVGVLSTGDAVSTMQTIMP